jgi:uncharacterized pyridoxamine 5'-phosphate oxidase family protein
METIDKAFILEFIKNCGLAVIATVTPENNSESALIGFGQTENLELIFGTNNTTRKYGNIMHNPQVSFVIGWDEGQTVQYEGVVHELSGDEMESYKKIYFAKHPTARAYESDPRQRYFKVLPKWVRYTDVRQDPWRIVEHPL